MCGILGRYSSLADISETYARRALALLANRGPDDEGLTFSGDGLVLGHRRLAIIDLSSSGRQPMRPSRCKFELVFNGEVYNYAELRSELEGLGERFETRTDTEVIARASAKWGVLVAMSKLRGMYAIGMFDHETRELYLHRDPVGKKPLFLSVDNSSITFGSSLQSLVTLRNSSPEIDPFSVDQYFSHHFTQGPRTIFKGIEKVSPGKLLKYTPTNGLLTVGAIECPTMVDNESSDDLSSTVNNVESLLISAVSKRMESSDVPVGVMLSGGIDSSIVAAFAARRSQIRTFCVAHPDSNWDESEVAIRTAKHIGSSHCTLPPSVPAISDIDRLISGMCEPLADPSIINVGSVAKAAKEHVGVILTGDGGDEAFGGYSQFLGTFIGSYLRDRLPNSLINAIQLTGRICGTLNPRFRKLSTVLQVTSEDFLTNTISSAYLSPNIRRLIYGCEFWNLIESSRTNFEANLIRSLSGSISNTKKVMELHWRSRLLNDYLMKVDFGTMSFGLEARSPFLDVDLLRYAFTIRDNLRFSGFRSKSILRHIARKYLPAELLKRKKRGFVAPVSNWIRDHWRDVFRQRVLDGSLIENGLLSRTAIEELFKRHQDGEDFGYVLWSIYVLEVWLGGLDAKYSRRLHTMTEID